MKSYFEEKRELLNKQTSLIPMQFGTGIFEPGEIVTVNKAPMPIKEGEKVTVKLDTVTPKPIIPVPEELQDSNNIDAFAKTFTSFSGADMFVSIGNEAWGELQDIKWYVPSEHEIAHMHKSDYYDRNLAKDMPVVVLAKRAVFGGQDLSLPNDKFDINITYANEYGISMHHSIHDAMVLNKMSGCSVDSVVMEETFLLCAKDMTKLMPGVYCAKEEK